MEVQYILLMASGDPWMYELHMCLFWGWGEAVIAFMKFSKETDS